MDNLTRTCTRCGVPQPADKYHFYFKSSICRSCDAARCRANYYRSRKPSVQAERAQARRAAILAELSRAPRNLNQLQLIINTSYLTAKRDLHALLEQGAIRAIPVSDHRVVYTLQEPQP